MAVLKLPTNEQGQIVISEFQNLLLNLGLGLKPHRLMKHEVKLLEKEIGQDWFEKLGYTNKYKKPKF